MSIFFNVLPPVEALAVLLEKLPADKPLPAEIVPTTQALGRVTAESLTAPHPLPTFRRSTMDGYAVKAADTYGATTDMDFPSKMSSRKDFAEKQALGEFPHFRPLYDQVFADDVQLHEGALITHVDILGEEWNEMMERILLDGMEVMESLNIAAENFDKRVEEKEA